MLQPFYFCPMLSLVFGLGVLGSVSFILVMIGLLVFGVSGLRDVYFHKNNPRAVKIGREFIEVKPSRSTRIEMTQTGLNIPYVFLACKRGPAIYHHSARTAYAHSAAISYRQCRVICRLDIKKTVQHRGESVGFDLIVLFFKSLRLGMEPHHSKCYSPFIFVRCFPLSLAWAF